MIYIGCPEAMEAIRTTIGVAKHRHHAKLYICANLAHPVRRHAEDAVAQRSLQKGLFKAGEGLEDVTSEMIDVFFGWALKALRQKMQLH